MSSPARCVNVRAAASAAVGAALVLGWISAASPARGVNCNQPSCVGMDAFADIVKLRKSCSSQQNCCTVTDDLSRWIAECRQSTNPLRVDVGPGDFEPLVCGTALLKLTMPRPGFSHVTFLGSGIDRTRFTVACTSCGESGIEVGKECADLEFKDLSVIGSQWGILWWARAGNSTWTNTRVVGEGLGWYEFTFGSDSGGLCDPTHLATHHWFNSRIESLGLHFDGAQAYEANCGESYLFNTDLVVQTSGSDDFTAHEGFAALAIGANPLLDPARFAEVTLLGSTVRIVAPSWTGSTSDGIIAGVRVFPHGEFEMPDGQISVNVAGNNLEALYALRVDAGDETSGDGEAFAAGAAFDVVRSGVPGVGGIWRAGDPQLASLEAPYVWPAGNDIPRSGSTGLFPIKSQMGADLRVETDCGAGGDCNGGGNQAHLLIYNPACQSLWFDSTSKICRLP